MCLSLLQWEQTGLTYDPTSKLNVFRYNYDGQWLGNILKGALKCGSVHAVSITDRGRTCDLIVQDGDFKVQNSRSVQQIDKEGGFTDYNRYESYRCLLTQNDPVYLPFFIPVLPNSHMVLGASGTSLPKDEAANVAFFDDKVEGYSFLIMKSALVADALLQTYKGVYRRLSENEYYKYWVGLRRRQAMVGLFVHSLPTGLSCSKPSEEPMLSKKRKQKPELPMVLSVRKKRRREEKEEEDVESSSGWDSSSSSVDSKQFDLKRTSPPKQQRTAGRYFQAETFRDFFRSNLRDLDNDRNGKDSTVNFCIKLLAAFESDEQVYTSSVLGQGILVENGFVYKLFQEGRSLLLASRKLEKTLSNQSSVNRESIAKAVKKNADCLYRSILSDLKVNGRNTEYIHGLPSMVPSLFKSRDFTHHFSEAAFHPYSQNDFRFAQTTCLQILTKFELDKIVWERAKQNGSHDFIPDFVDKLINGAKSILHAKQVYIQSSAYSRLRQNDKMDKLSRFLEYKKEEVYNSIREEYHRGNSSTAPSQGGSGGSETAGIPAHHEGGYQERGSE